MRGKLIAMAICLVPIFVAGSISAAPIAESDWVRSPDSPYAAETAAEQLAAEVMSSDKQPKSTKTMRAQYLGEDRYYSLVEVVEASVDKKSAYKVETFRMIGTRIAASFTVYVQDDDTDTSPVRQQQAYEIAHQYNDGTLPARPIIYEGKYVYRPKKGEKCEVLVDELNIDRELLNTYSIDICR